MDDEPDAPAREWLSLGQASALLGVSQSTVRRWADAGELRAFRTSGGHRRIRAEDARLFLTRGGPMAAPMDTDRISELALARAKRRLSERREREPNGGRERGGDQKERRECHRKQGRGRAEQRNLPKVVGGERQRPRERAKRNGEARSDRLQRPDERRRQPSPKAGGALPRPRARGQTQQQHARHRRETQLERSVPERAGLRQQQQEGREPERVDRRGRPPHGEREEVRRPHHRGANGGRRRSRKQNVAPDGGQRQDEIEAVAPPQKRLRNQQRDAQRNPDVQPGNRKDMGEPRPSEVRRNLRRQPGAQPQQHRGRQRRRGLRRGALQRAAQPRAQMMQPRLPSARAGRYLRNLRPRKRRADSSRGEVLAVVERPDFARRVNESPNDDRVAVAQIGIRAPLNGWNIRRGPDDGAPRRGRPAVGGERCELRFLRTVRQRLFRLDAQAQRAACRLWRA